MFASGALGACGVSTSSDVNQAVRDAAHVAHAVTQVSETTMRSWCPAAVASDGGRQLSRQQAQDCLRRAWNGWLSELRRNGYDANEVGQGK
jgi:hypothetical protein